MSHYEWQGINCRGEAQSGYLDAPSRHVVKQQLSQQGILIRSIQRKTSLRQARSLKPQTLSLCFRQLATSLNQGVPILPLLESMATYQANGPLKLALKKIHQDLSQGSSLFDALKNHPACFPELTCLWVQMGEQFGTLPAVLQHIAEYYATEADFKRRMRQALTYPLTLLLMASLVMLCLMMLVVPEFTAFYRYFGADLPFATQVLIVCSKCLSQYGFGAMLACLSLVSFLSYRFKNNRQSRRQLEGVMLSLPWIGRLFKLAALARMASTLRTTYVSGLSLMDAFQAAHCVAGYITYIEKTTFVLQLLRQGEPLRIALQRGQLFPQFVSHLLSLGEETGTLATALRQITSYYDQEIEQRMFRFTTVFEPVLIALLGVGLGGLILALYLPILNIGSIV